ncbi:hypothetical protein RJ639_043215 [Escallonia herrerae]|uniref:RING-type E3 ubiquitin transferase n=1 Tax=Escallonia herrerae TaxID=1293975 RepID=A0AA89B271_9ASTE|nr:hypothetical protein RJ639_043214 [Escallonia herrerae]KAK3024900.1 hypothetical protein RJ639_043215 [Escallonia herrerae]
MDDYFDLDMALTMEDEDSGQGSIQVSQSRPTEKIYLPTVAAVGVCTVCMEGFNSCTGGKQVPCGHMYHETCITRWLSLHDSCPLCRCQVSGDRKRLSIA